MADTFASFALKLERFAHELSDEGTSHALGRMAKEEAESAASADLGGDPKFSGWAPTLDTRYDVLSEPGAVMLRPTRRSAGPWTVAEVGRNQGNATAGFVGPGINRATGLTSFTKSGRVRKVRAFGSRRWNGRTRGFGTASTAHAAIERKASTVVDQRIGRAIRRVF